ncbi:M-phase phosphoprotein 8 [Leucoraja erinacea]|uniref:M-phase phosphoprotein 8 n=1 Tax=Leucoraja erinaceus TaxID=7782 RepID=UPI00245556B1|nr:M-phase phosphoprotein 8 [Leucoraja erinacea]
MAAVAAAVVEAEKSEQSEQESEAEEDVYEVERIVDMKVAEGQILYRVHWKGYPSDDDTWEPEAHLEDCTEVLHVFKQKSSEKSPAKDNRKLNFDKDIFEDESDDDFGGATEISSPKVKKKKKTKSELDMRLDSPKMEKKVKSIRSNSEEVRDNSMKHLSDISDDDKVKKRTLTESKKLKKKHAETHKFLSNSAPEDDALLEPSLNLDECKHQENLDLKNTMFEQCKDMAQPDNITVSKRPLESSEEDDFELMLTRKKKKRDKVNNVKQEMKPKKNQKEDFSEKKHINKENTSHAKKQKSHEIKAPKPQQEAKGRKSMDGENSATPKPDSAKIMKKISKIHNVNDNSRSATEKVIHGSESNVTTSGQQPLFTEPSLFDKLRLDSEINRENLKINKSNSLAINTEEKLETVKTTNQPYSREKLGKKGEAAKELSDKRQDVEKGRKEQSGDCNNREMKGLFDKFFIPFSDVADHEDRENKRVVSHDLKIDENRAKEKLLQKDKKKENDSRIQTAVEETHKILDTMPQTEENADGKMLKLGVDLQLDWMTLEDFQKHLDGNDDLLSPPKVISNSVLRDAVKNGNYLTVKLALNSSEEYNLDQEDPSGMNLIMFAAAGGQDDILRLLIKKGAKISSRQKNGTTALMHAAEKNYLTTVAILLEAGSQLNAQQISGETALMKACKRGNADIVRLLLEYGADCGILSKHQNSALYYAKQSNNILVYDLLKNHVETISRVADETIRDYFEARLSLLEPVFPVACHRLCEGPDFALDFNYKPQHSSVEGTGILLFIFHANFFSHDHIVAKLCGSCSVQAVILNDKFQLPVFLDSHFIYSFSPVPGTNKLFIRLAEAPTAKVKLLICAYRVQLQ